MTDITKATNQGESTVEELKDLLREAERVLADAGDAAAEEVTVLRDRLRAALADGRTTIEQIRETARRQAESVDARVRSHPYESIGIAAGVGALLGFVLSRSCR